MSLRDEDLASILTKLAESPDDSEAWKRLYFGLWSYVVAIVTRELRGEVNVAEDISQEVFLAIVLQAKQYNLILEPIRFRKFLRAICRNKSIDYLRLQSRKHVHLTKDLDDIKGTSIEPVSSDLPADVRTALEEVMQSLNSEELIIIDLINQGVSYREIADHLRISASTVHRRLTYLRSKISEAYKVFSSKP